MTKLQHSFFFEHRGELYTGEETEPELLLNGIPLSSDIWGHINGFIGDESKTARSVGQDAGAYLICHDPLYNQFVFPIEDDEKYCFEQEYDNDFILGGGIYSDHWFALKDK